MPTMNPETDMNEVVREGRKDKHRDTQKNWDQMDLGSLMEKSQHPRSSVCLLYVVEKGGGVITHR